MTTDNNIETDDDRDAESDDQTDTRRGVMRSIGIAGAGLAAGLLGRPAADAVDDAMMPEKPIKSVSLTGDSIEWEFVENPEILMIRIVKNEKETIHESISRPPNPDAPSAIRVNPDPGDSYEVIAYRGTHFDDRPVQTVVNEA